MRPELTPGLANPSAKVACEVKSLVWGRPEAGVRKSPSSPGLERLLASAYSVRCHRVPTGSSKSMPMPLFVRLKRRPQDCCNNRFGTLLHKLRCGVHTKQDRRIVFHWKSANVSAVRTLADRQGQRHCQQSARSKLHAVSKLRIFIGFLLVNGWAHRHNTSKQVVARALDFLKHAPFAPSPSVCSSWILSRRRFLQNQKFQSLHGSNRFHGESI